ncbi:hypothetical protein C8F01DRAFT_1131355 [Mycena amicta]|nr:hypothetical protein C8F01DRAFT_1131355 [Mycena amicta]
MSTFIPSAVNMSNERDWAANLGHLDWDSNIVFTKRSLLEFLKYTGHTVDIGFSNISKLPRYAKFGKIVGLEGGTPVAETPAVEPQASSDFKPTRRVRELPGGARTNIFGDDVEDAPPKRQQAPASVEPTVGQASSDFRPTRRVRELPGGARTNIFGDDVEDAPPKKQDAPAAVEPIGEQASSDFRPTRRVRELPGGTRTNIFGDDVEDAPPKKQDTPAAVEPTVEQNKVVSDIKPSR